MLNDSQIDALVTAPKRITERNPTSGYRLDGRSNRCDLELEAIGEPRQRFAVFIRQNLVFIENFSIGLMFHSDHPRLKTFTLVRYNGPHGESSASADGHYSHPHIHYMREAELGRGHSRPEPRFRELTDRFATLEQALICFFTDTSVEDYVRHFPNLAQGVMSDESDFS